VKEAGRVYAIIRTGGKQYRAEPGETIYLERLEAKVGDKVTLDDVLLVSGEDGAKVGAPRLAGASVIAKVVEHGRDAKVRVFKYKKRKHYRKTRGHRQGFTAVRIETVQA
jgi:large subunit ribosomal protein L21